MIRSLAIGLTVVVLLASAALGQSPDESARLKYEELTFDFTGNGARAAGMGRAFLAISDDVTGGGWNPAGTYLIDKPVISLTWSSLAPRGSSTVSAISGSGVFKHSGSFGDLTSLNFAAPVRIKGQPFVGSFSYTRSFDVFETANNAFSGPFDYAFATVVGTSIVVDTLSLQTDQVVTSEHQGGVDVMNFAFATRLLREVSVGLSINVYTGSSLHKTINDVTIQDWQLFNGQTGTANFQSTTTDTNKYSGINFTLGGKYDTEKLDLALVIRTPFKLDMEFDRDSINVTRLNDLVQIDQTDTTYYDNNLTRFEVPLIIGAGVAYQVTDDLLCALDIEYRGFEGKKVLLREEIMINPEGSNEETFLELDPKWRNSLTIRTGAEYMLDINWARIPLRAGFGYIPIAPAEGSANDLSTVVQTNLSVGSGLHIGQIRFDAAYTYASYDREVQTVDLIQRTLNTALENRNHNISVSFTGVF